MKHRKIPSIVGVAVVGICLATPLQAAADPISNTEYSIPMTGEAVRYIKSDTLEEAQRIVDQPSTGFQSYALQEKYGPCTLIPRNVHVRTRTNGGDARIIGFKPVTECNQPVELISQESTLKYKYYVWWKDAPLKYGVPTRSSNRGVARLEQRNVEFHCNGHVNTAFIGHTVGAIVANGETYYATVNTNVFQDFCEV